MRTEEIRFVAEVCRTGSIAGAARNLNITPQGLGKAIQKLENELGVKLFTRTFEGVVPTASCNQIYDRLTKIVNTENEIRQIIQQYRRVGINEEIFLIGSNTVGIYVEEAVNAYNIKYGKNIRILQSPLSDDIQEQAFLENKYAYRYCCLENMKNNTLPKEEIVKTYYNLFVGRNSPLTGRKSVSYGDLSNLTLLVEEVSFPHVQVLLKKFDEYGVKRPELKSVTTNTEIIALRLSADPSAVFFARARDRARYSRFTEVDFEPCFYTTLCLETHNSSVNTDLLTELRKKLKDYNKA